MKFEPGTPSAYVLAIATMTAVSMVFFGVSGALIAGFFSDIGYSVDPNRCGRIAALSFGVMTFVLGAVISYRDYHFQPPSDHKSNR